jgi:hypothetical protein
VDLAESTRIGQWWCLCGHRESLTRELALDLKQIRPIWLFSHETLMDGEVFILEVEDLIVVQIGEHWID